MSEAESRQGAIDDEHLRLLSYGYAFSGVMTGLFSLLGLFYAGMGLVMSRVFAAAAHNGAHADKIPAESLGAIFGLFGFAFFLFAITVAALKLWTAHCIRQRRSRLLCLFVAGICCLGVPYGTVLGVCTFLVLGRQDVTDRFTQGNLRNGLVP